MLPNRGRDSFPLLLPLLSSLSLSCSSCTGSSFELIALHFFVRCCCSCCSCCIVCADAPPPRSSAPFWPDYKVIFMALRCTSVCVCVSICVCVCSVCKCLRLCVCVCTLMSPHYKGGTLMLSIYQAGQSLTAPSA